MLVFRAVNNDDLVGTMLLGRDDRCVGIVSDDQRHKLATLLVDKVAAGIQQLKAHVLGRAIGEGLDEHP